MTMKRTFAAGMALSALLGAALMAVIATLGPHPGSNTATMVISVLFSGAMFGLIPVTGITLIVGAINRFTSGHRVAQPAAAYDSRAHVIQTPPPAPLHAPLTYTGWDPTPTPVAPVAPAAPAPRQLAPLGPTAVLDDIDWEDL